AAAASCVAYLGDTPPGTYCLLPNGETCAANTDCVSTYCNGTCKRKPIATANACDPDLDTCEDADADCITYHQSSPTGYYCLLPIAATCTANDQCGSNDCNGTCVAEVCTVCSTCPFTTVQAALSGATDGDTIRIDGGTYTEDLVVPEMNLTITNCNSEKVTLKNASDNTRTLVIGDASTGYPFPVVTIRNITVTGKGAAVADQTTPVAPSVGDGGIDCYNNLNLEGTTKVTGCNWLATAGGGVFLITASLENLVTDSQKVSLSGMAEVSHNYASQNGGGIGVDSYDNNSLPWIELKDSATVSYNATGGSGGGIHTEPYVRLSTEGDAVISHNRALAGSGGGVWFGGKVQSTVWMKGNSQIVFNSAANGGSAVGGGIYVNDYEPNSTYIVELYDDALVADNTSDGQAGGVTPNTTAVAMYLRDRAKITRNTAAAGNSGGVWNALLDVRGDAQVIDNTPVDCSSVTDVSGSKGCGV
ncbi:MAG: hypothetical protein ACKOWF_08185, partial [Chloroflexota bacterium]